MSLFTATMQTERHGIGNLYDEVFKLLPLHYPQGKRLEGTTSYSKSNTFRLELLLFPSPVLEESLLFSFPPLINMLKFRG